MFGALLRLRSKSSDLLAIAFVKVTGDRCKLVCQTRDIYPPTRVSPARNNESNTALRDKMTISIRKGRTFSEAANTQSTCGVVELRD
jgi:hypothetical protein